MITWGLPKQDDFKAIRISHCKYGYYIEVLTTKTYWFKPNEDVWFPKMYTYYMPYHETLEAAENELQRLVKEAKLKRAPLNDQVIKEYTPW